MRGRRSFLWGALVLIPIFLVAFGASAQAQNAWKAGKPKVAVVVKTITGDVFQKLWAEAARDESIRLGGEATIHVAGGQTAVTEMVNILEDLIAKKVDIIIISPLDSKAADPLFAKAKAQGTVIVCVDQKGENPDNYLTFISIDNYKAGTIAGKYAAQLLGGKGKVLVVEGAPGSSVGDDRRDGFVAGVTAGTQIKVAGSQTGKWSNDEAFKVTQNMLQAVPDADLIYTCSDVMVNGALQAIKLAGKEGKVKVVSFDGSKMGIGLIKQGNVMATMAQYPFLEGNLGAEIGMAVWRGVMKPQYIPKFIDTGTQLIIKDNADAAMMNSF